MIKKATLFFGNQVRKMSEDVRHRSVGFRAIVCYFADLHKLFIGGRYSRRDLDQFLGPLGFGVVLYPEGDAHNKTHNAFKKADRVEVWVRLGTGVRVGHFFVETKFYTKIKKEAFFQNDLTVDIDNGKVIFSTVISR